MRYWKPRIRYEINRRIERLCQVLAHRMPGRLRVWVVVDSMDVARRLYPHLTVNTGPDALGIREIHDGARRKRTT